MFCSKCGRQLLSDAKFCDKCGTAVPESVPPAAQQKLEPVEPGKQACQRGAKTPKPEKPPKEPKPPRKKAGRRVAAALCILLLLAVSAVGAGWLLKRPRLETVYVLTGCTYLFEEGEERPYFTCEYENGRPVEWTDGSRHYKATYDEYGNPTRILIRLIDGDKSADQLEFHDDYTTEWEFTYSYDRDGVMLTRDVRIHEETSSEKEQTYSQTLVWNVQGQLARITTGNRTSKMDYNGEIITGESDEKEHITFDYDDEGRLVEEGHGDHGCLLYSYTQSGALKRVELEGAAQTDIFTLYYDSQDRLTKVEDHSGFYGRDVMTWEYSYDRDGNLESFDGGALTYDRNGNIIRLEHEEPLETGEIGREYTYEAVEMTQEAARFYRSWLISRCRHILPFGNIRWPFHNAAAQIGDLPSNYLLHHPILQFPLP